ncbi:hypothetical protein [Bradyrhizobium sp. USDA 10063]
MNIDPRNTTDDPIEACDSPRQQQQPGGLSAQTGSTAHSSADQANFEQQLSELRPIHRVSESAAALTESEIGSSSTVTKGNVKESAIREGERYPASSFVKARAQLVATLAGANAETLRNEIESAEQRSAQWSAGTGSSADSVDGDRIFDDVLASSYLKLRRFQNEDSDCKPRAEDETSAISHVRSTARERSCIGDPLERYPLDRARQAGWHMRGRTESPFVSLVDDASKLLISRDPWARAIANNASTLHTYTIPRAAIWTPEAIMSSIALGMNVEDHDNIDADVELMASLGRTPTRETERLFLGGNLDDYRTASEPNPYRTSELNSESSGKSPGFSSGRAEVGE